MNILYVLNSGNPGGMEYHVRDLIAGMTSRGHNVYIWCRKGDMTSHFKDAGAKEIVTINLNFEFDPKYIFSLMKYLKQKKIDVVHAHELKPVANAMFASYISGVPVRISHTHTPISEWKINPIKKYLNMLIDTIVVNLFSTAEIALTESRCLVKNREGISSSKLEIIPNGLDMLDIDVSPHKKLSYRSEILNKYNVPSNAYVIGNVSRMTEEKGHKVLIDAFNTLLQRPSMKDTPLHLFLAGGGKLESEYRALIKSLGLENKVTITGVFSNDDLPKFYNTFDMFVFPTYAEGFGIVLMEAMAAKLPIICSDLPVLHEVAGSTVLYAETGEFSSFVDKMYYMYTKRAELDNLKTGAYNRLVELYSIDKFISNYEALYSKYLERSK